MIELAYGPICLIAGVLLGAWLQYRKQTGNPPVGGCYDETIDIDGDPIPENERTRI